MEDDHTEESSDGTLARGDDHINYTHKQEYVEVIDADVTWRMNILYIQHLFDRNICTIDRLRNIAKSMLYNNIYVGLMLEYL